MEGKQSVQVTAADIMFLALSVMSA